MESYRLPPSLGVKPVRFTHVVVCSYKLFILGAAQCSILWLCHVYLPILLSMGIWLLSSLGYYKQCCWTHSSLSVDMCTHLGEELMGREMLSFRSHCQTPFQSSCSNGHSHQNMESENTRVLNGRADSVTGNILESPLTRKLISELIFKMFGPLDMWKEVIKMRIFSV